MQLELANGKVYNVLNIIGENRFIQGATRDCLEIQMEKGICPFDQLDSDFSETNTAKLTITTDEGIYIHEGYQIRMELSLKPIIVAPATVEAPQKTEDRICVTLAQLSYEERQLNQLRDAVDCLVLSSLKGGNTDV